MGQRQVIEDSTQTGFLSRAEARAGAWLLVLSQGLAYLGGFILIFIALVTVVSVIGRALLSFGLGPVRGDYEIVANGCAIAVFLFLPLCQLQRGHVTVDILTNRLPARAQAVLGLLGDALITLAALVVLRQLWFGFGERLPFGSDALRDTLGFGYRPYFVQTTYELQIPVWLFYGGALIGAAFFALVALYSVWRSFNWVLTGREARL